ncbi:DUF6436 domain-containing protein [Alteromonas sp. ASW11-36]|uniref:DUF6436 domain-containing protein n=1 Tax=Alteromonas arenosi TaxID=3055817 RepID=A0ABT7STA5_9ALTE|nr:DUF6436 domain-containing protein [Alteromonas sp. ASW11-36]MDM7859428.1 DUF6436 domain-containing protein [Alteromonas sp. ASW11-36]
MRWFYVLFVLWIGASITALVVFSQSSNLPFDDSRLYNAVQARDFERQFGALATQQLGQDIANTVVHFSSQDNCMCETVASRHIQAVKNLSSELGKNNIDVALAESSSWLNTIPATPAVAVFDANGELTYLGPYAEGAGCFTGQGIVESHLDNTAHIGATILMEAEGCYCRAATKKAGKSQPFAT